MYQMVIEKYPDDLYRVSKYGVFVPDLAVLPAADPRLPAAGPGLLPPLYDARAKEAFEQAGRSTR